MFPGFLQFRFGGHLGCLNWRLLMLYLPYITASRRPRHYLISVHDWLNANKLSLHIGKTNSILICSSRKRASLQSASLALRLDDEIISPVEKTDWHNYKQ
jgi:hypothetical protein